MFDEFKHRIVEIQKEFSVKTQKIKVSISLFYQLISVWHTIDEDLNIRRGDFKNFVRCIDFAHMLFCALVCVVLHKPPMATLATVL